MKPEIVKFANGKYGIRKTSLFGMHTYLDFRETRYWWPLGSQFMASCQKKDLEEVQEIYALYVDKGVPL